MLSVFLQGLSLGLAYVAPIGMQNLFVIDHAVSRKFGRTMATALIVVFWDVSLGLACFLGVGALMGAVPWLQKLILGCGGLLVIRIGLGLICSKVDLNTDQEEDQALWRVIGSAFVVTWLNPQALIDGSLMLGAFRASLPAGSDPYFISGFALASFLWFNCLAAAVHFFGSKINCRVLARLNRICGAVIVFYGVRLLVNLVQMIIT